MHNLTEIEIQAIDSPINLSDGHPRMDLTSAQETIVGHFAEVFQIAKDEPFEELERLAHRAFFQALGQSSAPLDDGRVFSVYSSSVATMALAAVLAELDHTVALLHPTFDNIHDIIARTSRVLPISEQACAAADLEDAVRQGATCVFVTTPNNPTGWYLDERRLRGLARACAERDVLLCLDTSFRGFDTRTQFDSYAVLNSTGVEYVVIEDTGKLWPMLELKLGFIAVSEGIRPPIQHALSDVLLSVSPVVLKLVEMLSTDAAAGGFAELHALIAANRAEVRAAVAALDGVEILDGDARVSVSRLRFDSPEQAERIRLELRARGVHVLPCGQFHWARPEEGASVLRLALGRNTSTVVDAVVRLRDLLGGDQRREAA